MNIENNEFFNRCFNIVASFEVQNENQMIAKEVILDEVVNLQQRIDKIVEYLECALDEEKETPSKYHDWRLDLLEMAKGETNE